MDDPFDAQARFDTPEVQDRLQEYLQYGDTRPLQVDLDITTECNYRCTFCGDLARGQLNRGGLNATQLLALLDDMHALGVRDVSLIGGGEPTASPHFCMVIEGLRTRGIRVGVVTNGSLITDVIADCIADTCSWIRISLDAGSRDTYGALHHPPEGITLDTVVSRVSRLARRMPGRVGISFLVMNRNVGEIEAAARIARGCGCSYIRIRPAQHPMTGRVLPIRDADELRRQLDLTSAYATKDFLVSVGDTWAAAGDYPNESLQRKEYFRCHAQAFGTTIAGTGAVFVCSKWRGEAKWEIGNVRHTRLTEIWSSEQRRTVLAKLNPSRVCSNVYCQAHVYNELLDRLAAVEICV
ncbi:MAG: radical SAM protein [Candidatus Hydrogenedentes bacterium]|nr:radical SAM protein [Candidatus Hydrogenedentota bacterium]